MQGGAALALSIQPFNESQRTPTDTMAHRKIQDIEGIGPATGDRLRAAAGVADTHTLLARSATPAARQALAEASGPSEGQTLLFNPARRAGVCVWSVPGEPIVAA